MLIALIILTVAALTLKAYSKHYCLVHAAEIDESRDFYGKYSAGIDPANW